MLTSATQYAVESQIEWHGLSPKDALVTIFPEGSRNILITDQICRVIDENASTTAVLWLSGVQYYTGQVFDLKAITRYAQNKGILVGWDLAHAVGNILLELHEWGVDFVSAFPGYIELLGKGLRERNFSLLVERAPQTPIAQYSISPLGHRNLRQKETLFH